MSFQEGSELAGLGDEDNGTYYFEVNFNSRTREFEIVTIWPYDNDIQLPGGSLVPKAGDRYVLWNLRMPDEYYALAEEEFMEAVNAYNREHAHDISVFKATTDHVWIEEKAADLSVGRRVRLESNEYFPGAGFRESRITKITRKVNLPSQMDIEIGDVLGRTSKARMNDEIRNVRLFAEGLGAAGNLPDIIRTGDRTRPTDNNLFSALLILRSFLSKLSDDRSEGTIASDVAMEVGNFESGVSGAKIWIDKLLNNQSVGELDRLIVRVKAIFRTLTIIDTESMGGELMVTPGGGVRLTDVDTGTRDDGSITARCYFLSEQDGVRTHTRIKAGDLVKCQSFNLGLAGDKTANRHYWLLVKEVSNNGRTDDNGNAYGYIEVYVQEMRDPDGNLLCQPDSVPEAGDEIVQLGNTSEPDRQTAIIVSTVASDSPSINMYSGIDCCSLAGRRLISIGYDHATGKVRFRLGKDGDTQYIDYTQDGGLEMCGKINVRSTIGDRPIGEVMQPEAAYRLGLTQTTGAVRCDADGNITAELSAMPCTQIMAYKGNALLGEYDSTTQTGYRLDSIEATAGVYFYRDTTKPQGTYTMQKSAGMTADTATATFNVSVYENGTKVATLMAGMSLYKVRPGQGGAPGENGQSPIRLVLSQEVIGVPCDANGTPTSVFFPVQITAHLFRGDKSTVGTFSTKDDTGCSTAYSGATITVTGMSADTATFTVVGTETNSGVSAQLNVSLYKVIPGTPGQPGTPGEPAVVYTLEPSVMVVKRGIDGTAEPDAVSCMVYKTTGNTSRVPTDDNRLYYRRIGPTLSNWVLISRNDGQSGTVSVNSTTEEILFGLFGALRPTPDSQPLALARIPVLTDAEDLEGSGINLLKNTNQGTRCWTNDMYAQTSSGGSNPRPLPALTESGSVPPGVVETNSHKYPFGKTSVSDMPTLVEYQMFFNLPKSIVLKKGKKYTLSFDADVAFRGTDITLDYGINAYPNRESLGTLAIGASSIHVEKTFSIDAGADKTVASITVYVRLTNANVNGTGSYDGKGRSQFDRIEIRNLKLEKGSLATAWTPAPDDMHYLTQAFRESTTISGGVVMTSRVRVGYTDNNGAWHETGGLNGIAADYESNVVPTAPILYCGGEMIDKGAPEYTPSANAATSMIRLDGSAYFANNTVRFRENVMEMGDYITLQDDGLRLFDPNTGEEKLFMTNGSVGTLNDIGSITPQTVSASRSISMYFYRQTQTSGTALSLLPGYYLKSITASDSSTTVPINGGAAISNANSTLKVTVTINFTVPSFDSSMLMKASLAVVLQSAANGTYTWADVARYPLRPANTTTAQGTFTASADIFAPLSKGMKYRLKLICTNDEAPKFSYNLTRTMALAASGKIYVSQRKTVLGNDGFATVWGNTAALVKEGEAHLVQDDASVTVKESTIFLKNGNTELRVDAGETRLVSVWDDMKLDITFGASGIWIIHPDIETGKQRMLRLDKLAAAGFFDWK